MKKLLVVGASLVSISFYGQTAKSSFQKGEGEYYSKKYQEAVTDFDKALETEPANKAAHYYKAMCESYLGDNKTAVEEFTLVIDADAKNADALINRGRCKQKLGDKDGACEDWNKAKELGDVDARAQVRNFCH